VNLNGYTTGGQVTSLVGGNRAFYANGVAGQPDNWFTNGLITFQSGENFGLSMEIRAAYSSGYCELEQQMPFTIAPGDNFLITAGCTKRFNEDCVGKFHNGINFRGFPHLPLDKVYTGP
jgi:uncharacterized phage protein (TIGR02218 family)